MSLANAEQPVLSPEEQWLSYLRSLARRKLATPAVAVAAENLWRGLRASLPAITRPNASPTDEGGLSMSWNLGRHYLEIEIRSSSKYDWFYRDRDLGRSDRQRAQIVEEAPTDVLKSRLVAIFEGSD
ncbi:MAG TPA: hypothetical protein VHX14_09385 [Thermoanaerobaculia bacterium]|jgi:hypothetical protein|nr:hypothetical protein [Thermoanaerobaculia bacterium]